jgi:23S rRNA (guanosine2251-2'-O)-methyltransferase
VERQEIDATLPPGAVHQGVALLADPLEQPALEDVVGKAGESATIVVLDRVTDPHNIGAVLRSAAAFGALAVVQTERGAPAATGIVAKSASGALEAIPLVTVTNLARTLDLLQQSDFWSVGLDGDAERTLAEVAPSGRIALVLGAEGKGLRRLTRDHCDILARLPTRPPIASLNISNAAAVALYELNRG